MVEDREKLINGNNYHQDDRKSCAINKHFIVYYVGLVILMVVVWLLLTKVHNPLDIQDDDVVVQSSGIPKVVFPKNLSEMVAMNRQLCQTITYNETGFLKSNNANNIYIVKGERNLTDEQACGVESILRLFPDKTIYLIDFNKDEQTNYSKCSAKPNYLGLLLHLYKDRLQLVLADKKQYFKHTPLSNFTKREDSFEFMAMLLTAYKYGGFVASPDVVMTTRDLVQCFPDETIVEPFTIFSSKRCDSFLHYLMQSFSFCGHVYNSTLESALTQSAELYSRSQPETSARVSARRLNMAELSYDARDPRGSFLKLKRFEQEDDRWVNDLSRFCKQVVQAYLGIRINKMQVEEETNRIKSAIAGSIISSGNTHTLKDN